LSFFSELRRRNVFRVGFAYLAGVWLVLQVADVVLPNFGAPAWIIQTLVLSCALGFPLALVLAWFYELTPEGIKATDDVEDLEAVAFMGRKLDFAIIGALVLAVGFLLVDDYTLDEPADTVISAQAGLSIAVLPFVNISPDPDNEYFSDGLSEEILNLLAQIPLLKVIGRTSSFAFKGRNEDLRVIGQALGVNTLLEGSVRKSGDVVRITAQLIDVSDGAHIWSQTYDRTMTDIFAVQDDVAAAIIDALSIHVGANPTRGRPTENSEAYALFLKGRVLLNAFDSPEAERILLEAIELDPNFAEAHELLAGVYWSQAGGVLEAAEGQRLMGETAAKALAIDPDLVLAQALHQSGNLATYSLLGELEALERAAREKPDDPWILAALVFNLRKAGYLQEALTVAERLVELDPLSPLANGRLQTSLFAVARIDEAFANQSGFDQLTWGVGEANLAHRRDDVAIAHFEADLEQNGFPDSTWVSDLVTGARDPATGQAYLDRRIAEILAFVPAADQFDLERRLSKWYLYFGFLDRFYELILDLDLTDSTWTDADDLVDVGFIHPSLGFTGHPQFLEVAELVGVVDVWEQRGPPDICSNVGGDWVCAPYAR